MGKYDEYFKPPTIEEMKRTNPYDHMPLIQATAIEMVEMNTPYTGKVMDPQQFEMSMAVNIAGIVNGCQQGTAKVNEKGTEVLFWHPGVGEYVPYSKELQEYLLGFIGAFKQSLRGSVDD